MTSSHLFVLKWRFRVVVFFRFRTPGQLTMGSCRGVLILGLVLALSGQSGLEAQKNIPEPKLSKLMGPTIKFLYCYS